MIAALARPELPKVTIMIPTYGQADMVLSAIDSALAQDYANLEVVVADDASPDNTAEVVASRKDSRLRYHRNRENLGRVANYRNALYHLATGAWVVNLDGDDRYIDPAFISAAISLVVSDPEIVMVSGRCAVEKHGKLVRETSIPRERVLDGCEMLLRLPAPEFHLNHMTTLYRRETALDLDFYRLDLISSDWESLYRLAAHGRVAYLDRVIGIWRVGGTSASQSSEWCQRADNLRIWTSVFNTANARGAEAGEVRRARTQTIKAFGYLGFSDVLRGQGIRSAFRYLAKVWKNDKRACGLILSDYRVAFKLWLALFGIFPGKAG